MKRTTRVPHRILFVSQDAGGFQAIIPVYRRMVGDEKFVVRGLFGNIVRSFPSARGLRLRDPESVTDKEISDVLERFHPTLVVTGLSAGRSLDKRALTLAKRCGIKTISVLDFFGNYKTLFGAPGGRGLIIADRVCVPNETCRRDLIRLGIPRGCLVTTGSPAFDAVRTARRKARGNGILFICQPFSELEAQFKGSGFGLDERCVFADLVYALETSSPRATLTVRWHPRTRDRHKFDSVARASRLRIHFDERTPIASLIAKNRVIVGMNSTALFEAVLRGASVVSYQPGLRGRDPLLTNRLKLTRRVATPSDLERALRRALRGASSPIPAKRLDAIAPRHATERVLRVIEQLLIYCRISQQANKPISQHAL